jgi:hypothetical protein
MFSCVATIPRTPARLQDSLASLKSLDKFINHFFNSYLLYKTIKLYLILASVFYRRECRDVNYAREDN